MKFLLLSIGTRGDMEPLLAIGDLLAKAGHQVRCVMPAQFEDLVADAGLEFRPLDRRFMALIESSTGRAIMGQKGGRLSRIRQLIMLARQSMSLQKVLIEEQREYLLEYDPDRILYHPKALYGRMWGMKYPERAFAISPIPNWLHPVREYSHVAINKNLGVRGNRWTYQLINWVTARVTARMGKAYRADLDERRFTGRSVLRHMKERERVFYMVSPSLFPEPEYWPAQARVMGYLERPKTNNWLPDSGLSEFLEKFHDRRILFFTFGSMVNSDPAGKTQAILAALLELGVPAILNTSSGGLIRPELVPDNVYFVDGIPYEWIFPKVYGVIHHGGSGTTHTTVKHGCASLVIPHIIDQFFWNRRCADLGLGPLGVPIKKLNQQRLVFLLRELIDETSYRSRSEALAAEFRQQDDGGSTLLKLLVGEGG